LIYDVSVCIEYEHVGLPKGVELTHYNLIANVLQRMEPQYDNPVTGEAVLAVLPVSVHHFMYMYMHSLQCLYGS
jgi:long-subunit acyl-CoA synthetase (AMP-forming)